MNEKDFAIERITTMHECVTKRLWILCLVLILICAVTNAGWIYYESQFETVESTSHVTQENESGYNNYIGNDGDINNGETNDSNDN